jgi:hypothetical protein
VVPTFEEVETMDSLQILATIRSIQAMLDTIQADLERQERERDQWINAEHQREADRQARLLATFGLASNPYGAA